MSEICEVIWEQTDPGGIFSGPKAKFYARAIGYGGKFIAAESEEFRLNVDGTIDENDLKASPLHRSVVNKLIHDGWQPVEGTSAIGFHSKFKRMISSRGGPTLFLQQLGSTLQERNHKTPQSPCIFPRSASIQKI